MAGRVFIASLAFAAACCLVQTSGCGYCIPSDDPDRLEVTDDLRDACDGWEDEDIQDFIYIAEQHRQDGQAQWAFELGALSACERDRDCRSCLLAISDQVYDCQYR